MTWAELAVRADRFRAAVGVRLESPSSQVVAVVGGMGIETVVALLALLEDRAPFVLLHPRWSRAERDRAMAMAGASLLIESDGALAAPPAGAVAVGSGAAGTGGAVIVFTSGTSGLPRGAVLGHKALRASSQAHTAVFGWKDEDRWLLSLPAAHVGGLMIVVRSLMARRTIVLGGRDTGGAFDPHRTLGTVARDRVTLLSVVPTMLGRLLDAGGPPPPSLRAVLVGGAPASPALMLRARQRGWPVFATYGLTEACSQVATEASEGVDEVDSDALGAPAPGAAGRAKGAGVGPPLPGVEVRIAPADAVATSGSPVAARSGSIQVRGSVLFDGYLGVEAGAPLRRPFDADGWFDTGDLGALDESGRLWVIGRRADRILTGGENVDPAEVEAAVAEWPGATAACVVGLEDEEWGERVAAVVARTAGFEEAGGLAGLKRHLRARLAGFKRPRCWQVVERLPAAPSGKVDRRACFRLLARTPVDCSAEAER